ncbi:hypothetical protein A3H26_00635 [candidate division WWE3 bacterium RIFCSPLOWO2_12_FULL_36_10]|uniref:Glycosyltransferase RgtA/B/C/D-like domain-containing protein n=1 Tax=candidate division WWE3 bacterium RIFCSPLOWO2_12_FULL_36_10 TaxID=1802630 RepID=A0A1F4VL64_UNCKA|nr:MAG: hypothetical protein A3H26_00635 [candidate division WWE3 bacterium RIFCSPLOWO2_12_FULL_36_10]
MYVIGPLEDQTVGLVWSQISDKLFGSSLINGIPVYTRLFHELISPWSSSQPVFSFLVSILFTILGKNGYNILLLVALTLNLLFSYLYFKKFRFGFFYSIFYSFSSYTWIHLTHLALMQIWLFPLFLILLEKFKTNTLTIIKMALFITLALLISNYLGFFILMVFFFDCISEKLTTVYVKKYIQVILLSALFTIFAILPFIKLNYFSTYNDRVIKQRSSNQMEDFLIFSSKPWHFFLPSTKNPIYGNSVHSLRLYLENVRFILIFDQYFDREHNASFFGFSFLLTLAFLISSLIYKHKSTKIVSKYLIVSALILLFMMPPYILIRGIKFYTPGYVMYTIFPMFRSLSRLSIVLLLYLLTIFGTILDYNYVLFSDRIRKLTKLFIPIIFIFTLFEVFVPQSVRKMDIPPNIYTYIGNNTQRIEKIAVYPYNKTNEAVFWIPVYKRELVNPRGYEFSNYSSETFTKSIPTEKGLKTLNEMGINYLVIFKTENEESLKFLFNSQKLSLVKDFGDSRLYLVR